MKAGRRTHHGRDSAGRGMVAGPLRGNGKRPERPAQQIATGPGPGHETPMPNDDSRSGRPRPDAKPGATHTQVERRERFQRARREDLSPDDDTAVLYGWHTVTAALQNPQRRIRKFLA